MPSRKAQKKQHWRRSNPAETHNQRRPSKKQLRSDRRKLADDEWRGCLRKVRFGSQAAAEVDLRKRTELRFVRDCQPGKELQVYECRFCLGWHLGHGAKK